MDDEDYPDYDYDDVDECDHEDAEVDILTGKMECACGSRKYLNTEEFQEEMRMQAERMQVWEDLGDKASFKTREAGE